MTAILTISPSKTLVRSARLLLVGASGLALSAPLAANQLLFTTSEARLFEWCRGADHERFREVRGLITGG